MLSLLSLASAETCWQLDWTWGWQRCWRLGVYLLLVRFNQNYKAGKFFAGGKDEVFFIHTCACQCEACSPLFSTRLSLVITSFKIESNV